MFQGTKNYSEDPEHRREGGEGYQLMPFREMEETAGKSEKVCKGVRGMTKEKRRLESVT